MQRLWNQPVRDERQKRLCSFFFIRYINTKVAVGGGHVVSNITGTVTIRSLDHKHVIHCENVLFIPQCGKKLMPASQFIRKGCTLTYKDNKVRLLNQHGSPMFDGKEFDGLFYFRLSTIKNAKFDTKIKNNPAKAVDTTSSTFFGICFGSETDFQ